ncbi:uncharacterized protein LOC131879957 [Tigriopus californicus]|uniref:uncharacterized protein LOC131879957 n=1 Tax=Tigriopus californicus TaxID=6832 RepID=UPI0027DAB347|nr:uncharacterized protein LOC131879957 [Tigriopus californicus]|eukprot:TCALIF_07920-PA protein Name:"Similar to msta Protein msta, isoform A (Drosophila melanogaster)" AED:0.36 eAED:0.36 QI:0/1/0.66/1/1/1/3/29/461
MKSTRVFAIQERSGAGRALISTKTLASQELVLGEKPAFISPHLSLFTSSPYKNICPSCYGIHNEDPRSVCANCTDDERLQQFFDLGLTPLQASICQAVVTLAELRKRRSKKVDTLMTRDVQDDELSIKICQALVPICAQSNIKMVHIRDALGVLATNGVKVQRSSQFLPCVALYSNFSMANHSCLSNCNYMYDPDTFEIELRTKTVVPKNRELTITYLHPMMTTQERREATQTKWGFTCMCNRCCDATELGTFAGSIWCQLCGVGVMSALSPRCPDSTWCCGSCRFEMPSSAVNQLLKALAEGNISEQTNDVGDLKDTIFKLEETLWRSSQFLHWNHAMILNLEYRLMHHLAALDKIPQRTQTQTNSAPNVDAKLPRPFWERRLQIGLHLLEVVGQVDRGKTKWRGMVLQDVVISTMELAKRDVQNGSISKEVFKAKVNKSIQYTHEAVICLKFEPRNQGC